MATKVSDVVDAVKGSGKGDKASANPPQPPDPAAKYANSISLHSIASGAPFPKSTSDQAEAAMNLGDDVLLIFRAIEGETELFPIGVKGSS